VLVGMAWKKEVHLKKSDRWAQTCAAASDWTLMASDISMGSRGVGEASLVIYVGSMTRVDMKESDNHKNVIDSARRQGWRVTEILKILKNLFIGPWIFRIFEKLPKLTSKQKKDVTNEKNIPWASINFGQTKDTGAYVNSRLTGYERAFVFPYFGFNILF